MKKIKVSIVLTNIRGGGGGGGRFCPPPSYLRGACVLPFKKGGGCVRGGFCQGGGGFCLFPNCHTLSLHRQDRDNILCKQPQKIDYRKGGGGGHWEQVCYLVTV